MNCRLILIEGFPGSGKTTIAHRLATALDDAGQPAVVHTETDPQHPIFVGDIRDLDTVLDGFETQLPAFLEEWRQFAMSIRETKTIHIVEGRFWLTGLLLLHTRDVERSLINEAYSVLLSSLAGLDPALIYMGMNAAEIELQVPQVFKLKNHAVIPDSPGNTWEAKIVGLIEKQPWCLNRDLAGSATYVTWLKSWLALADDFFSQYPYPKMRLNTTQENWDSVFSNISSFCHGRLADL